MAYCKKCDTTYCKDCGKEWKNEKELVPYYSPYWIPATGNPTITWEYGTTCSSGSVESVDGTNLPDGTFVTYTS